MEAIDKLKTMINKEFMYQQQNTIIEDFQQNVELVTIIISQEGTQKRIKTNAFDLKELLKEFLPVSAKGALSVSNQNLTTTMAVNNNDTMNTIKNALIDSITKVQEDPGYINQAKQISNSANSLINLAKTELELIKMNQQ